jgi:hypothetical protein
MRPIHHNEPTERPLVLPPTDPVRIGGFSLGKHRHVGAFFHNREEQYRILLPFVKEGLDRGEKAIHIVDRGLRDDHRRRLATGAVEVAGCESAGQLSLLGWEETYLRGGRFDQHRMLDQLSGLLAEPHRQGFSRSRLLAHMEWALGNRPGSGDLVEYETRLNYLCLRQPNPVVCVYDLTLFSGDTVVDLMRTHPVTIIGGTARVNSFFVSADEFLEELRERAARRALTSLAG